MAGRNLFAPQTEGQGRDLFADKPTESNLLPSNPEEQGSGLSRMVGNIPGSAANMARGIYEAVSSPIEAVKTLGSVGGEFLDSISPETGREFVGEEPRTKPLETPNLDAFKQFYVDRYGGWDKAQESIINDPVGVLADMSAVLGGSGAVLRGTGALTKIPAISKTGQAVSAVGRATNPLNVAREAVTAIPRALTPKGAPQAAAVSMIEKQLKPSTTLPSSTRQDIVKHMLDKGINVTKGGLSKLEKGLERNSELFDTTIKEAAKRGETVNVARVARHLARTRNTFKNSLFADDLLPHVDRADELLTKHRNVSGGGMPIDKARAMKTDLHKALKGAYGELSSITDEAMKDIVHGINTEVWKKYPALKAAGQDMRVQIALERELERAVNRLGNNNAISLQDIGLAGTAGVGAGGAASVSVGLLNKVLRVPAVKGYIARALNKAKTKDFGGRQLGQTKASVRDVGVVGNALQNMNN